MIGVLTCLVLIVLAGVSAELVRAGCRRRLMAPLPVRQPASGASADAPAVRLAVRPEPSPVFAEPALELGVSA